VTGPSLRTWWPPRAGLDPVRVLVPIAVAAVLLAGAGCSHGGSTATTATNAGTTGTAPAAKHAAPDLEALLPGKVEGKPLRKGSTTGAVVFGRNAFGAAMTRFLAAHGKTPRDLRFANAQTSSSALEVEVGVFEVRGLDGAALARAIVSSSRPNAPGLTSSTATLSGRRVTKVVYPGGSTLYLYPSGDRAFYVGTQSEALAGKLLARLP
jgi:hypothetical protein